MSVILVNDLTFAYDGSYDNIFEHVSFRLDTDWRLGLIGRNGRGKTTLLRLLMGQYEYSGSIVSPVTFDYFPFAVENRERQMILYGCSYKLLSCLFPYFLFSVYNKGNQRTRRNDLWEGSCNPAAVIVQ